MTVALNAIGIDGSFTFATAAIKSSMLHCRGSYSTRASCPSNVTVAWETPFTAASADRTGSTQPSHVMPEMVSVTLASCGFAARARSDDGETLAHADVAITPTRNTTSRLDIMFLRGVNEVTAAGDRELDMARSLM